ncbi:MAG: type III-B CRISPR module RAMP protein Cmr4 [Eubacteriaceae bacterium]|nr:type III-B CRISPR module RAMP protein Cmr4 [Eubacteriaceae bacterium]
MDNKIFTIETITNLHVGDLGDGMQLVDKQVQKDVLTKYPTIHASSLKGALREHCEKHQWDGDSILTVFGGDVKDEENKIIKTLQGRYRFVDPMLLAYPLRTSFGFVMGVSDQILKDTISLLEITGKKPPLLSFVKNIYTRYGNAMNNIPPGADGILFEQNPSSGNFSQAEHAVLVKRGFKTDDSNEQEVFDSIYCGSLAVLNDKRFSEVMEELPIVARNKLESGLSANLWYEEFVPRKTLFILQVYFEEMEFSKKLEDTLKKDYIQIGANATVGYGICKFQEVASGK